MGWMLPPLNPLKAFEAAGRHGSLTLAAAELNVTQAAVSRHIRVLEDYLGTRLFDRGSRSVSLTAEGARLLAEVTPAFAEIDAAAARIRTGCRETLRVQAYTTFALRWLIPRLARFHTAHPEAKVQLVTLPRPVDFERENVDGAIWVGDGSWPGASSLRLIPEVLVPVCAPGLAASSPPLRVPSDLASFTLLHSSHRSTYWRQWLEAAGCGDLNPERELWFEGSSLAYQAAIEGIGVAVAERALVEDDLARGKLITPFRMSLELPESYYFVTPRRRPGRRIVVAFRDWLASELRSGEQEPIPNHPGGSTGARYRQRS